MDKVVYISLLILKMIKMQRNLLLISLIHFLITSFLIGRLQPHTRSLSKTVLRRLRVWLNHTFKIAPQKIAATFEFHITVYIVDIFWWTFCCVFKRWHFRKCSLSTCKQRQGYSYMYDAPYITCWLNRRWKIAAKMKRKMHLLFHCKFGIILRIWFSSNV